MRFFSERKRKGGAYTVLVTLGLTGCSLVAPPVDEGVHSDSEWISPLTEIMAPVWAVSLEEREQNRERRMRQEQEYIALCMLQSGFEYIPDLDSVIWLGGEPGYENHPDDVDWVSQYGYGVMAGRTSIFTVVDMAARSDPNAVIVARLSESEQIAYDIALNGPVEYRFGIGEVIDIGSAEWREVRQLQGCVGRAEVAAEATDPLRLMNSDEFRPLQQRISEFQIAFNDSSELAAIDSDWANCMADSGYPGLTQQRDAQNMIENERFRLLSRPNSIGISSSAPEVIELREREIEVALADLHCREITSYSDRVNALQFAWETQFIADNRIEFDALQDAIEQRGF